MTEAAPEEITYDTLLRGRVGLYQPAHGFRSSLDPVLLAGFATPPFGRFLDIGCGTGALSFLLLARDPQATGVGVEIQPRLAALAEKGSAHNGFGTRLSVRAGDVRSLGDLGSFDLVATNPPFRPLGTGVLPPDPERSIAHHEVALTLAGWLAVAEAALAPTGRLCVIFPADRLEELAAGLAVRGLTATRRRFVHPQAGLGPTRVLVEGRRTGTLQIEPPLVVHESGVFTPEVRRMLGDE
jgi:tRNA1Val (adenine37-N6)-methyltransferase